jgi:dTDP-4-dehydrorhamnose reductase
VIVNCAAWTNVDEAEKFEDEATQVNGAAVGNIACASKLIGASLVHISTDYVFSGIGSEPWQEDDIVSPLSAYGRSKAVGERLVSDIYPEKSYIIRTAWLYSKYGKNFAKTMCEFAYNKKDSIMVVSDQIGQPTFAGDLVRQIYLLVTMKAAPGIYHGTNSGDTSWFGFAKRIFEILEIDTENLKEITTHEYGSMAQRPLYSVLSHKSWIAVGLSEMRNWQLGLTDSIKEIYSASSMR